MGRPLRCIPEGGLVEVTARTFQGRFLMLPGPGWTEIFIGCIARAQALFPVSVHAFIGMSNHLHMLVSPDSAQQLAAFMGHLLTNLSKEASRRHGWQGSVFRDRYRAIPVTGEDAAQIERLAYLLRHGVKEGLVDLPEDWPGPHCVYALETGAPLEGVWISRSLERRARERGPQATDRKIRTRYRLRLAPLPCWAHHSPEHQRRLLRELLAAIRAAAIEDRRRTGRRSLGAAAILAQDPHAGPAVFENRAAPIVHAATRSARVAFLLAYREFVTAYYAAKECWRAGFRNPGFPAGAFLPPPRFGPSG